MTAIAQVGPLLVMIPAVIWLYWTGSTGWGTLLLVWALVVGTMDNFLRPVLIKKGADLPLLLIFSGVVGGLIAFVDRHLRGPVVLAVGTPCYRHGLMRNRQSDSSPSKNHDRLSDETFQKMSENSPLMR
jgi:hypothetical protein